MISQEPKDSQEQIRMNMKTYDLGSNRTSTNGKQTAWTRNGAPPELGNHSMRTGSSAALMARLWPAMPPGLREARYRIGILEVPGRLSWRACW